MEKSNIAKSNIISLKDISVEQFRQILAQAGVEQPIIAKGKLNMITDTTAECLHCKSIIKLDQATERERQAAEKTGLCEKCQNILKQAAVISAADLQPNNSMSSSSIFATENFKNPQMNKARPISAGQQCRNFIFEAIPNMTKEHVAMFCNAQISHEMLGILYPLFVKVTGFNDEQISIVRKPKGFNRYTITKYHIHNDDYLICNDLYDRHIAKFKNAFIDLGLIQGEKIEEPSTAKRVNKNSNAEETSIKRASTSNSFNMISFAANTQPIVKKHKKTKEELLADVENIEAENAKNKKERLQQLKKKYHINFSRKNRKLINNQLTNSTVNM